MRVRVPRFDSSAFVLSRRILGVFELPSGLSGCDKARKKIPGARLRFLRPAHL